jgi:hypothetical protein
MNLQSKGHVGSKTTTLNHAISLPIFHKPKSRSRGQKHN